MVAEIIINSMAKQLNKTFDYIVPDNLINTVKIGNRVFVPFGPKNSATEGYIIGLKKNSDFANKEILKIEDSILIEENIELAKLMSKRYFSNISECIKLMLPPGEKSTNLTNRIKDKKANFVYLKKDIDEIELDIEIKKIKSPKHIKILQFLIENEGIYIADLEAITETSRAVLKTLEKNGYIEIIEQKVSRDIFKNREIRRDKPLKLTEEQQKAFNIIDNSKFDEFLIYGVTGSGKTEIYLQLIQSVINKGKTAIVLVPEISLTPQMVDRFLARFGDCIAVLHSKLSIGERNEQWKNLKEDKYKILIGARSAIFAPIKNLGIIIIDEEHDSSYKSDMSPKYNAKEIAKYIAKKNDIPLVLGSATPEITTYSKSKNIIELTKRANNSNLPTIEIVDLRKELANGNRSIISQKLHDEIEENLKNKKQTILFLNRRGFSTFVMCRDCGYTLKCKRCNISLTYHSYENELKCHYCGYTMKNITVCPSCKSKNIRHFGSGTQKLEEIIQKEFPTCSTIRMDIDTVTKKNSHEDILNKFKNENIDILIGTQMVVKGHHFPNVTLVGVIAADSSLNMGDFRANEKTFDLLVQVAGRAGRENLPGKVIIQTYSPENFCIQCSKNQDYKEFYKTEIELRKQLKYPPFCDIILFGISSFNKEEIQKASEKLYAILKKYSEDKLQVMPPLPAPIDKIKNRYRWRIVTKCKLSNSVIKIINKSLEEFYKLKYKNIKISCDANPNNML